MATLTYAYKDSTAVVGPLALQAEPGAYDLCRAHAGGLSVPRGWEVIRLPLDESSRHACTDDLLALANAVREVGLRGEPSVPAQPAVHEGRRKGHLVVVSDVPLG